MTTWGSQSQRRALRAVVGMALAVMMAAACESPGPPPTIRTHGTPLPKPRPGPPPVIAVHFDRGRYPLLGNRVADLAKVGQGFNAVLISSGDDQLVREARGQGLKVYLGFDEHKEFAAGKDITADVRDLVRFAQAHRHEIAGIRVADRVNQGLTPEQTLDYLRATGGVLHREVPAVPVIVDLSDPQLTCDLPGQDRCNKPRLPDYRYQVDAELLRIYHSGYVDGFMLANGLARSDTDCGGCDVRELDARAQATAWRKARAMFPSPFLLFARVATLSFPQPSYPGNADQAALATYVYETIPLQEGVDGVDLWAWSRQFDGTVRTFLNKNGADNSLWQRMVAVAAAVDAQAQARPS
jgi:hypothetical protein